MTHTQEFFQTTFPHLQPRFDFPLAPLTYFKIGGPAEVLVELKNREDIIAVVQHCAQQKIRLLVLGGASNVILSSNPLKGVVIITSNESYQLLADELPGEKKKVLVGAGYKTALFVRKTIDDSLKGLEYFLGVPGKVGGAVLNNAHYLSDLVGQHIHRVEVVTKQGEVKWLSHEECQFGYDDSVFQRTGDVILQAEFILKMGSKQESMELIKKATVYRATTQPLGEPSSGCYFRNVANNDNLRELFPQFAERKEFPSAFLIDKAGLKGQKMGGIEVSTKHAAFFINKGQGTSQEVKQLAEIVKSRVKDQFGVELHEEVFFIE
jgi:UDP-N-acetylmuramate dehydrogenase